MCQAAEMPLRTPHRAAQVLMTAALVVGAAACSTVHPVALPTPAASSAQVPNTAHPPTVPVTTTPPATTEPAPVCTQDCDIPARLSAVATYLSTRPGTVGYVLRDRKTGAVYRNAHADAMVWTASTIKLAMVVDLFIRDRSGEISLTDADRTLIQRMLHSSDDNAADTLWFRYAGPDHMTFNRDFARYGMTDLQPERGFTKYFPYWGFQKCTPNDLDRLIQYVLTELPATERDYIVRELQHVAPDQQWGVWGAGPAEQPGNKDGWSLEQGGWVINSVGFVGPGQRYTLAMMDSLNGQGGYDDGVATDSHVAQLLLTGLS